MPSTRRTSSTRAACSKAADPAGKNPLLTCFGLFRRSRRGFLSAEARGVGAVDQGFGTFGRQVFEPVDTGVDVVFPHLARHLVEKLDAIAIRVIDIDAVRD